MKGIRLILLPMLLGLVVPGIAPATPATPPAVPTLVGIRAAHHAGFDRIVFQFDGGLPASHRVQYVDQLTADGSGKPVRVAGRAVLRIVFDRADAHDANGSTAPGRTAYALPNVLTTVRAGDFEAVTTYGIGLARKSAFDVTTRQDPARVVVDVRADFATTERDAWFLDEDAYVANDPPFFVHVPRPVPTARPFFGVLDRLFAGPLPNERAAGLRLLRSHATGFADLRVADGVARVRLTGGCDSDGSTITIADEIMPTLRQLPRVDWVKIYGPGGHTETPNGHSDSIPTCLEP